MSTHRATAYLILRAERSRWVDSDTGIAEVWRVKITGLRQSRPSRLERDEVAVKVTVEIPAESFNPIQPSALIVVPSDLVLPGTIGVETEDARADS